MSARAIPVRIASLALGFPSVVRTNHYFRTLWPDVVAGAESHSLAKIWAKRPESGSGSGAPPPTAFEQTMMPYLADPFRGAVERRIRARGETALSMELTAARGALAARGIGVDDIDLAISSSFVGDRFGVGNASYLAAALGLRAPVWNFETACASSVVGVHLASELVQSGAYRRILLVVSTSNSVQTLDSDSIAWFVGDGAGAFVIEPAAEGEAILGSHTINSIGTNDMFVIRSVAEGEGTRLTTVASAGAASMARDTAEPYLLECVQGALAKAALGVSDVDFWVFNTPSAWYADFCGAVLGVPADRYHSIYPRYANIGGALMPTTLYHALEAGRVKSGQVVAFYAIGSSSTASALVLRVGQVALGPSPSRPPIEDADARDAMLAAGSHPDGRR